MTGPRAITPGRVVRGRLRPPGSKSASNRHLVLAAGAVGTSVVRGLGPGDDVARMLGAIEALGATVDRDGDTVTVTGTGGPPTSAAELDAGASGTTMRFVAAFAATGDGRVTIDGTARMRERPIGPLVAALRALGAEVEELGTGGYPPVAVRGPLSGGEVLVDATVSSQFASAILLAAPFATGDVRVRLGADVVSRPYLEGTVAVLTTWGVEVVAHDDGWTVGAGTPAAREVVVEPDASAAVYPWVGAAITGGDVVVEGLRRDGSQADLGVLDVLEAMGAEVAEEPTGIRVRGRRPLRGVDADLGDAPDGALAVAVAAATAEGPSRLDGLGTLRVKETDRLGALETELRRVGAGAVAGPDHLRIEPGPLHGAVVHTYDDHRIAMSFALLGLVVAGIEIEDPGCVAKTWPSFFTVLEELAVPLADVIAIDGPAGTGKTTVSTAVAERLGRLRLDTGAFYRAATLVGLRAGIPPGRALADELARHTFSYDRGVMAIDGEDVSAAIRAPEVTDRVSAASAVPEVREQMVEAQRAWVASSAVGVVVEGRDIGTVVFPGAITKVYLDARAEVRAARRAAELGTDPPEEEARIRARDEYDRGRAASPLRPADDAWHLDTSDLTIDEVVAAIVAHHRGRVA